MPRPILIDEQHDGPCEICAGMSPYQCVDCGAGGELSVGPGDDHYHLQLVDQIPGRVAIAKNRCQSCYAVKLAELQAA